MWLSVVLRVIVLCGASLPSFVDRPTAAMADPQHAPPIDDTRQRATAHLHTATAAHTTGQTASLRTVCVDCSSVSHHWQ